MLRCDYAACYCLIIDADAMLLPLRCRYADVFAILPLLLLLRHDYAVIFCLAAIDYAAYAFLPC